MSETIDRETWASFLDDLTEAQRGQEVVLEILHPEQGDQHEADGLPLASIGYDRGDDAVIIELSKQDDPNDIVVRRIVRSPRSVAATPPLVGQVTSVRVENDEGVTLVGLRPHDSLPS